jgi:hypothetical protein
MTWIKCSDRLPKENGDKVLVSDGKEIGVAYKDGSYLVGCDVDIEIAYWMPLPTPPSPVPEWISVKDRLPDNCQSVFFKTDCEDCPINGGTFFRGKFVIPCLCQCDSHYKNGKDFTYIGVADQSDLDDYNKRITHWMPRMEL